MTPLAAYLLLFVGVGVGFILVHLLLGALVRPNRPDAEKETIYECGEPTIGSAWIQFDLRYYVVALLFVVFDVEVAFFFPWAEVFGKANAVANMPPPKSAQDYNKVAATMLDLDVHPRVAGGMTKRAANPSWERRKWEALRDMTPEAFAACKEMKEEDRRKLSHLPHDTLDLLRGVGPEAYTTFKTEGTNLHDLLQKNVMGDDAATPLADLVERSGSAPKAALAKAAKQAQQSIRKHLTDPDVPAQAQTRFPEMITPEALEVLGSFSTEQIEATRQGKISVPLLQALSTEKSAQPALLKAREDAWWLAALALGEILVFFGVLLVGFAYLWRRGDIEWVRSTVWVQPNTGTLVEKPVEKETAPTTGA